MTELEIEKATDFDLDILGTRLGLRRTWYSEPDWSTGRIVVILEDDAQYRERIKRLVGGLHISQNVKNIETWVLS